MILADLHSVNWTGNSQSFSAAPSNRQRVVIKNDEIKHHYGYILANRDWSLIETWVENKITFVTSNNEIISIFTGVQVHISPRWRKMNKLMYIYYEKWQKQCPTVLSPQRKEAALWNDATTHIVWQVTSGVNLPLSLVEQKRFSVFSPHQQSFNEICFCGRVLLLFNNQPLDLLCSWRTASPLGKQQAYSATASLCSLSPWTSSRTARLAFSRHSRG